jgi:hypothetical protein
LATVPVLASAGGLADRADGVIRPWVEAGAYQGVVLLAVF